MGGVQDCLSARRWGQRGPWAWASQHTLSAERKAPRAQRQPAPQPVLAMQVRSQPSPRLGGKAERLRKTPQHLGRVPGSHWAVAVAGLAGSCWLRQLGDQTGMEGGRTALPCGAGLRPRPPPHPIPGMRRTADAFPDGRGCLGRAPGPMCHPAAV